jgi:Zn-dependent protease with chaperone function
MNIHVSDQFKDKTIKAVVAIVIFIIVYIALLIMAIGLTGFCMWIGYKFITLRITTVTILGGIGIASLGVFVLYFLFKFMFSRHKVDRSHLVEITKEDEPKLFEYIDKIVKEVDTEFPKKIYLSSDVNACVFYDSSFWSMFFPIRKNLQIGLGLVNSISQQEFKAILAHEFGHFAQRSMKVGSYVYNVNQIIYNMLYDNESFDDNLNNWASSSGYFYPFAWLGMQIINAIKWILARMYEFVNIRYMALSREMEFHADEVAANIAGYVPLKESLLRMDLADYSYNAVLQYYDQKNSQNIKSNNVYKEQQFVMNFLAEESNMPIKNNIPQIDPSSTNRYNKSKLNIKDQWASHPSTDERIEALEKLNIVKDNIEEKAAFTLFTNGERTQEILTEKLFLAVSNPSGSKVLPEEVFKKEFESKYNENRLPKIYNGYYDQKAPIEFDLNNIKPVNILSVDALFDNTRVDLVYEYIALQNDILIITKIGAGYYPIRTFDYDGQKYEANEAPQLSQKLKKVLEDLENLIVESDKEIYNFFYIMASKKGLAEQLKQQYKDYFTKETTFEKKELFVINLIESLGFLNETTPTEQIEANFNKIKSDEDILKSEIKEMLANPVNSEYISADIKRQLEKYLALDSEYFYKGVYHNDNLEKFTTAIKNYRDLIYQQQYTSKLELLNYQLKLIGN